MYVPPKHNQKAATPVAKSHKRGSAPMRKLGKMAARMAIGAAVQYPTTRRLLGHVGVAKASGDSVTVVGTDYVTSLAPTTSASAGDTLWSSVFHMGTLSASRLAKFAQLYENYRVESLRFHFESCVPTSQAGSFAMYFDYDPTDDVSTASAQLANAYGHRCNVSGKWYESVDLNVPRNSARRQDLLCTPPDSGADDPRDYAYGKINVVATSALAVTGSLALGSIFVTYKITFTNAAYHQPLGASFSNTAVYQVGNAGWMPAFQNGSAAPPDVTAACPTVPLDTSQGQSTTTPYAAVSHTARLGDQISRFADTVNAWAEPAVKVIGTAINAVKVYHTLRTLVFQDGLQTAPSADAAPVYDDAFQHETVRLEPGAYKVTYTQMLWDNGNPDYLDYITWPGVTGSTAKGNLRLRPAFIKPDGSLWSGDEFVSTVQRWGDAVVHARVLATNNSYHWGPLSGTVSFVLNKTCDVGLVLYWDDPAAVGCCLLSKHAVNRQIAVTLGITRVDPTTVFAVTKPSVVSFRRNGGSWFLPAPEPSPMVVDGHVVMGQSVIPSFAGPGGPAVERSELVAGAAAAADVNDNDEDFESASAAGSAANAVSAATASFRPTSSVPAPVKQARRT